ncbi:tRNA glutamyl-Q(34) synthetase GluQRS [Ascidiaceihabitans sp.]|jgi:glutamyl-Q tRNA(Asp) synthetase|nr:tRNA glutamyl-Q(34) synthetase GluQRS [Paracoccaceae bacterium]MDB4211902.1 tRNA glutamyl-Q(34) synthetase GluQRS [Ascidiaceihabitans sp.]MDB9946341.1 tRNA glutamyl-Q(34) synthetase GluQRS [Ascidiaceihabitans sp.]HCI08569.1 tRNA glutamyl-Q(34) synthetase GluQRS [Sulfitobacter sp.]
MMFRTRFAPSPTGPLHLGHAYSAMLAYDMAKRLGGEFLLRIEDIDQSRARASWTQMIYDDLEWLGLEWSEPVIVQSTRHSVYQKALGALWKQGFLYVCHCNRKDILAAASAPQEGSPMIGPDGVIYQGTCRGLVNDIANPRPQDAALRLKLCGERNQNYTFNEVGIGPDGETGIITSTHAQMITEVGDIVLSRKDMGTSYHLSVVLDDAAQGITHVVRGQDLFEATKIHVLLQSLLDLPTPIYHHHDLIRDDQGKRLAKRDDARAIAKFRDEGYMADDIRKLVGLTC